MKFSTTLLNFILIDFFIFFITDSYGSIGQVPFDKIANKLFRTDKNHLYIAHIIYHSMIVKFERCQSISLNYEEIKNYLIIIVN